ncbi:MAG: SIR2 family protein [Acidimicrobiaceae bacterium]|nr:SIR2 family protein [Acidimicrobiaceae bacterium]MYF32600.1 SIR2 family protein [Acidimicrobiaceae bacterium]MYG78659.1 SIR2 family protein [Acidimicrobiaceae bacterium]
MVEHVSSDVFARSFGQRTHRLAWLLGAGASASAGVPTAKDMIADFRARLFCARTKIRRSEVDVSDPIWEERITAFFDDAHGFPPAGDPGEYSAYFEAAFPLAPDRHSYIESAAKKGSPSFGHRVLASFISEGLIHCLFTTNFDPLIERTTGVTDDLLPPDRQAHLAVSALDAVERGEQCFRDAAWPLLVKLHGDYRSERLKNTAQELQTQDERLRRVLVNAMARFGLVVVGYSGRDESIMCTLDEAADCPGAFPSGLWWVARPGSSLLPRVASLLDRAAASGIEAHVVYSENFDELAGDLEREVELSDSLSQHIRAVRPQPIVEPVALPERRAAPFPAVRCSALELLSLPHEAREVTVDKPLTTIEARQLIKDAEVWATAASYGRRLAAFGPDDAIRRAFAPVGGQLTGTMHLDPAGSPTDLGLVYDALVKAIARYRPLRPILSRGGHAVVVRLPDENLRRDIAQEHHKLLSELKKAYGASLTGSVPRIGCFFAEAVRVRIEVWDDRWWLVYEPYTWVDLPREDDREPQPDEARRRVRSMADESDPRFIAADWRRERWAQRYNKTWHNVIAAWAKLIVPREETDLSAHYFEGSGINAEFDCPGRQHGAAPSQSRR